MIMQATPVAGRDGVLATAGDHPYVRLQTGGDEELTGYLVDDTTVWFRDGPTGRQGFAMGDPERAVRFVAGLISAGTIPPPTWLHLPRVAPEVLDAHLRTGKRDQWDFRWTATPPPEQPGEERVVRLTDAEHAAIHDLIESSFPATTTRPGDPRVNHWHGVWAGDRLVAAGADRSRGGTGFLAGLTVDPTWRGRGLGAALTAAMTRALLAEAEEVTLGVMVDNLVAIRLYERLGFAGSLARTSVELVGVA
ncbi:GNAT family N-acetyltransferase [Micromonospora sp. NPDC049559]|uniref:GNAT family N-acetyltransferase n=1 Tax=Micromonospora sp. NPDC049559 TaxID=3155923 RepID=UPI003437867F